MSDPLKTGLKKKAFLSTSVFVFLSPLNKN